MCVFLLYDPCIPYLPALIYGACYSLCYLFVGSYSPEDKIHPSLSNTGVRTRRSQRARHPVQVLVVPAYAQGAVAVSSLVMPVGCFSVFPLCLRLMLVCIYLWLSFCPHAVVPDFCLCLLPASLVPPVRTHVLGTERQWGNSPSLWVAVCIRLTFRWVSSLVSVYPVDPFFQIQLNCILSTVSFSLLLFIGFWVASRSIGGLLVSSCAGACSCFWSQWLLYTATAFHRTLTIL